MSGASLIDFEAIINQDVTKKSLFCICCMGQSGSFIKLASCAHKEYLASFPITDLNLGIPEVVCSKCHDILKTVTHFKDQVWNSLNILLKKVNSLEKYESTKSKLEITETLHCNVDIIDQVDNTEHVADNSRKLKNISTALGIINSNAASMAALTSSQNFIGLTETLLQATTSGFNFPLMPETVLPIVQTNNLTDNSIATSTDNKFKIVNKTKNETVMEIVHENINRVRDNVYNRVETINVNHQSHVLPVEKNKDLEMGNANAVLAENNKLPDTNVILDRHEITSDNIEMEIEVIKSDPDLEIVQEKFRKPVNNREAVIAIHFENKTTAAPINIKKEPQTIDPLSTNNESHYQEIFVKPEITEEVGDVGIVGAYGTAVLPDAIKFEPGEQEEVVDSYLDLVTASEEDKKNHTNENVRAAIVSLHKQNISNAEISRRLNVSRRTVQLWVRRYGDTGHIYCRRPGFQAVAYTDVSSRHRDVVAVHSTDPFASTRSTATTFNVSLSTVRRHLHAADLKCHRPAKKILMSDLHRQCRLRFAQQYLDFDWCNNVVIFSDEKCFKSDKDGRKILWRKAGERYSPKNVLPCRSSGHITLGYWGWMSSMGPGELVEVGGRNTGQGYLDILKDVMLPTVRVAYPHEHIYFVHDNCSVHRAQVVRNWFNTQENLTVIDWPAKSPDLNPIENLWGHMVLNWDPSDVRSKTNLDAVVNSTWESFRGSDLCWNMVSSMRRRLQEVIINDGAPTGY